MEKDTKRVWHLPYCFLEPGELEREFARLAAQGWLLEKCTYGTYTYRRGEPNEYEYRVQYIYESRDGQRTDYVKRSRTWASRRSAIWVHSLYCARERTVRRLRSILTSMRRSWTRGD